MAKPGTTLHGSCLCGGVRYEITGPLGRASHCHCAMCRKAHGAAFGSYARVKSVDFRFTTGAALVTSYRSSEHVIRTFCKVCGSTLQWLYEPRPEIQTVTLGTLDDDPGIRPELHIYVAGKAPWFEITDDLPQRAEG
jgi:hypothetical protein